MVLFASSAGSHPSEGTHEPSASTPGGIKSWWGKLHSDGLGSETVLDSQRDSFISLQWLVAVAICSLVFVGPGWNLINPPAGLLIIICLASGVGVQRIPKGLFANPYVKPGLLVFDSLLVICAIFLREQTPW